MQKDTVKDWARAMLLCDQIRIDADAALAVVNDLPSGMDEPAVRSTDGSESAGACLGDRPRGTVKRKGAEL